MGRRALLLPSVASLSGSLIGLFSSFICRLAMRRAMSQSRRVETIIE